jgi:hydrogenase/urease accessory protein HupE
MRSRSPLVLIGVALALILGGLAALGAHEIPTDTRVQAFFKPEGDQLRLLVRAPLQAMIDVVWPMRDSQLVDLARVEPFVEQGAVTWILQNIDVHEEDVELPRPRLAAARVSDLGDQAFETYERALAQVTGPALPPETELALTQGVLDVLLEYPIRSDQSRFAIRPRFSQLGLQVTTGLRLLPPGGAERAFSLHGDPGLVRLDPRWFQAAWRFVVAGFFHILDGIDHLLFLLCLVIPFRRLRTLVPIVTAFTAAHSITLIASAYDMAPDALWFPPFVETLIATSIVYMALENIVSPGLRRRWIVTFAFGLIHGFGFSFALREDLQFAGTHLLTSLVSFNVGVELGQLLVLFIFVPALDLLFRYGVPERIGTIIVSALVTHTGWHWMTERGVQLAQYRFEWPAFDARFFSLVVRWMILAVIVSAIGWLLSLVRVNRKDKHAASRSLKSEV